MKFDSVAEIIRFAIEKEKEAAVFYEDAAKQEHYSGASEAFKEFAGEERKHQKMLENFLEGDAIAPGYKWKWIPDIKRSDYLVDVDYEPGMSYLDMLRLAMKREEKSLKLYNELMKNSDKEEVKKVFKMLCQEEAGHKLRLESLYDDYMEKMGD